MRWRIFNHDKTKEYFTFARDRGQAFLNFRNISLDSSLGIPYPDMIIEEAPEKEENDS